jgi:hypothetical protein
MLGMARTAFKVPRNYPPRSSTIDGEENSSRDYIYEHRTKGFRQPDGEAAWDKEREQHCNGDSADSAEHAATAHYGKASRGGDSRKRGYLEQKCQLRFAHSAADSENVRNDRWKD